MERRYVIIDTRTRGDEYVDILPAGTTKEEAISKLDRSWGYLTDAEKKGAEMSLAYIAVEDDETVVAFGSDEYDDAIQNGFDTISDYTPIATRNA